MAVAGLDPNNKAMTNSAQLSLPAEPNDSQKVTWQLKLRGSKCL